jgi:hypothetical protein
VSRSRRSRALRTSPGRIAAAVVVSLGLAIAGCGDKDFANKPRPPAEVTVGAAIARTAVTTSPSRLRAGPIDLLISNQTNTSQQLVLRSEQLASGGTPVDQSSGSISPGDTASLKANLGEGTYTASVGDRAVKPARIVVGPPAPSAQDQVLQP